VGSASGAIKSSPPQFNAGDRKSSKILVDSPRRRSLLLCNDATPKGESMRTQYLLIAALLAGSIAGHGSDARSDRPADAAAAFSRLKTLAGEWHADTKEGKVHVSYEVVAGGTSLLERESGDKMPVMLTLFHVDGDRLLLTHYCMAGNQPRMQARRFHPKTGDIEFQFLDGTNLTPGAGHMHNARFQLVDDRHFQAEWQFYENGKLKFAENAQYTRVR
jgi:hypothetical protein